MEDLEIVELYFERSEAAIRETEKKYNAFLRQVAYNILRSIYDMEEIVNDTYMAYSIGELFRQYSLSARQVKYILSKTRDALRKYLEKEGVVV